VNGPDVTGVVVVVVPSEVTVVEASVVVVVASEVAVTATSVVEVASACVVVTPDPVSATEGWVVGALGAIEAVVCRGGAVPAVASGSDDDVDVLDGVGAGSGTASVDSVGVVPGSGDSSIASEEGVGADDTLLPTRLTAAAESETAATVAAAHAMIGSAFFMTTSWLMLRHRTVMHRLSPS
jgi:hypothetical protein